MELDHQYTRSLGHAQSQDKANILNFIPKTGEREVNIVEFDSTQEPPQDADDDKAVQPEDTYYLDQRHQRTHTQRPHPYAR
jgi:hypothetical protein